MTDTTPSQPESGTLRRFIACCNDMTENDRRNSKRYSRWMLVWMLGFAGVMFSLKYEVLSGIPAWAAIVGSTALGVVALLAFVRFLREADELLRKIQLDALAIGFGVAWLGHFTISLVERVVPGAIDSGDLFLVMVLSYLVGTIVGTRRYA